MNLISLMFVGYHLNESEKTFTISKIMRFEERFQDFAILIIILILILLTSCSIHGRIGIIGSNHKYMLISEVYKQGLINKTIWIKKEEITTSLQDTIEKRNIEVKEIIAKHKLSKK